MASVIAGRVSIEQGGPPRARLAPALALSHQRVRLREAWHLRSRRRGARVALDGREVAGTELAVRRDRTEHRVAFHRLAAALALPLQVARQAPRMGVGRTFGRPHRRFEDPLERDAKLSLLDRLVADA